MELHAANDLTKGGSTATFEDPRFAYADERFVTLARFEGAVVIIASAKSDDENRAIAKRKTDIHEQKIYIQRC